MPYINFFPSAWLLFTKHAILFVFYQGKFPEEKKDAHGNRNA